jgi:hypothetical protein
MGTWIRLRLQGEGEIMQLWLRLQLLSLDIYSIGYCKITNSNTLCAPALAREMKQLLVAQAQLYIILMGPQIQIQLQEGKSTALATAPTSFSFHIYSNPAWHNLDGSLDPDLTPGRQNYSSGYASDVFFLPFIL